MIKRITIVGDGAMGCVCAMLLSENNYDVTLWGHNKEELEHIALAGENVIYMPGYKLPNSLKYEADDKKALCGTDVVVSAAPCQFIRPVWERLKTNLPEDVPIVSVAKGVEISTLSRPTQVLSQVLGENRVYGALSGPTIADELARKLPASACAASSDPEFAKVIQEIFTTPAFRVYTNEDLIGVELAGAMKNVIAIAAGIIDGIGAGDNAKAALLARGIAEITRYGIALGANEHTFYGLSGVGDLVTTCISPMGRNRSFGEMIGKGMSYEEALGSTKSVVEGAATCKAVLKQARELKVEIPITEAICAILFDNKSVTDAINDLMTRQLKSE